MSTKETLHIYDIHLFLRSLIGLATREYATRRTLVSSRRKRTSTQLKQRWMLPMCRRRLARLTLRQRPTQVPRAPSHLSTSPVTSHSQASVPLHTCIFTLNLIEPQNNCIIDWLDCPKENPHCATNVLSNSCHIVHSHVKLFYLFCIKSLVKHHL